MDTPEDLRRKGVNCSLWWNLRSIRRGHEECLCRLEGGGVGVGREFAVNYTPQPHRNDSRVPNLPR